MSEPKKSKEGPLERQKFDIFGILREILVDFFPKFG